MSFPEKVSLKITEMSNPVTGATPGGGGGGAGAPGYFWARVVVLDFITFFRLFYHSNYGHFKSD